MKKVILTLIAACAALAAIVAIYRFGFRKSIPEAEPAVQVEAILAQNNCYQCHDAAAVKPFYGKLPLIGPMLDLHIGRGTKFVDLKKESLENPSEAFLAKLEYSVQHGNMPIVEYKLMHWGTGFNKKEKSLLTEWILSERASRYASGLNAPEFAGEPVQVMPESVPTCPQK